jgi:sodium transport system permease protein
VELIIDESNSRAQGDIRRARGLVRAWGQQIGTLRLQARGIDPAITRALQLQEIDVSTPTGRSAILLGMMSYFLIFSMLMGGMYLAIDTTAGERERGSLEPLLTLPVQRSTLIGGKILATCFYMSMSLAAALIAFSVSLQFLPLEKVGMTANFGPGVVASAFLILVPFTLLGASLMTVVASFTKSYKEAQSYMTVVLLLPTLPIMIAALLTVRPTLQWMAVPSLSQHLLVTDLIKDEALSPLFVATSVGSTLAVGIALTWLAMRLYHREGILG